MPDVNEILQGLSALDRGEAPGSTPAKEDAPPPAAEKDVEEPGEGEAGEGEEGDEGEGDSAETETEEGEGNEDDEAEAAEDAGEEAESEDSDLPSKNLDALARRRQRQEEIHRQRMSEVAQEREAVQRDRSAFEAERAKDADERREIGLLKARAKSSPRAAVLLLRQLGVVPEQFATVANIAYAMSNVADEKWKRQWGADDGTVNLEQEEMRRKVEDLSDWKAKREEADKKAVDARNQEAAVVSYVDEISKSIKAGSHQLLAHALQKNPERAKGKIRTVLAFLARETGDIPRPRDVVDTAERLLREELELYGASMPPKPATKPDAAKPKAAKQVAKPTTANGKPKEEKKDKTLIEELDEMDRAASTKLPS